MHHSDSEQQPRIVKGKNKFRIVKGESAKANGIPWQVNKGLIVSFLNTNKSITGWYLEK